MSIEGDGPVEGARKMSAGQAERYGGRALPHHGTLRHSQSALLPNGGLHPASLLGSTEERAGARGRGPLSSVPLGHVGIRTVYCLRCFPERAGICVAGLVQPGAYTRRASVEWRSEDSRQKNQTGTMPGNGKSGGVMKTRGV